MICESQLVSTRRQFTVRAIFGLTGLMSLALTTPAMIYVFGRPDSKRQSGWIDAGAVSELSASAPTEVPILRIRTDGWKIKSERDSVWIVKEASGKIIALSPRCTHLGCAYHWDASKKMFACPCHGSLFLPTGAVVSGPAPRPLDRYAVKIEGDRLWLGDSPQSSSGEQQV
jgi:quinol---cytochrome c reductase iron-sulfur subunit, bacillus type